jgi:hypothetical protein
MLQGLEVRSEIGRRQRNRVDGALKSLNLRAALAGHELLGCIQAEYVLHIE